jgi:hypothetical protein
MADAQDIQGTVFKNGSATFLARLVGSDGLLVTPATVSAVRYSIWLLDEDDPDQQTGVTGHTAVALQPADVLGSVLRTDPRWTADGLGYNFRHELDVTVHQAFMKAGRKYQVVFELTPVQGQAILVRFQVHVI